MVSPIATEHVLANNYIFSGRITSATGGVAGDSVDMRDFGNIAAQAQVVALTGNGITKVEIIASATSNMASPEVIKDSGVIAADALGDHYTLEASAEEIRHVGEQEGKDLRYASIRVTAHNAADVASYTYVAVNPRFARSGLTPASAIA